jgi:hypothetical protein
MGFGAGLGGLSSGLLVEIVRALAGRGGEGLFSFLGKNFSTFSKFLLICPMIQRKR